MSGDSAALEGRNDDAFLAKVVDQMLSVVDDIYSRSDANAVVGLTTGVFALDDCLGGLFGGDFVLIGGRPGTFKTPLALHMFRCAAACSSADRVPFFFTLEASRIVTCQRMAAQMEGIPVWQLRRAHLGDESWEKLSKATRLLGGDLGEKALLFDRCFDVGSIRQEVEVSSKSGLRPSAIFVDYVQLCRGAAKQALSRADELGAISRELKLLAREYDCPVVALSQVNRVVEDRPGKQAAPSDLRGSGSLEEDADVVLMLRHRSMQPDDVPDEIDRVELEVLIAKQKYGRAGEEFTMWVNPASGALFDECRDMSTYAPPKPSVRRHKRSGIANG